MDNILTPLTTCPGSLTLLVKILCSFNGSILPRPQDGKLRYVGGETRILSVPIDIGFDQLMVRMKDLFDGVTVLKYKQPNEDLDALVSVMNDDDVTNMMEEYDKDGFTRLRVFLFSNSDIQFLDTTEFHADDTPVNLHHLTIPPRSSVHYSPNNDFTSPPWCSYYHCPHGDRVPSEDYFIQHQSQLQDNVPWFQHSLYPNDYRPFYNDHVAMGPTMYRDDHIRHWHEFGNELFHDQHIARYGNYSYVYGALYKGHVTPSQEENGINYLIKKDLVESPPKILDYNEADSYAITNSYNLDFEPVETTTNLVGCSNNPNDFVAPTLVDNEDLPLNTMNKEAIQNSIGTKSLINKEANDTLNLSYIPQIVESVKQKALIEGQQVTDSARDNTTEAKEEATNEFDIVDSPEDLTESRSKIEQTKAEEEAIARGLQTIKNDDLEEIRQLGSGTYGAVYHGKWKGSDVAIKRIKASCFSGSPTERERMITDFWKEALMLSSLHHPNVVSFYGIVRDGSLATVTEYMINGSLKQFLKKKDR